MTTIELAYDSFGEPGDTPLLIVHGFLAASRNWRSVAKRLAEQRHVYVLDMRNHGSSPHAEVLDYPSMAADLLAFMDSHGIHSAHLLGHSMGGKAVMWFALHHPQRVAGLIVADIAPVSYQHSFDDLVDALSRLPVNSIGNRKQAEEALAEAVPDLAYRQFLLQNLLLKDGNYYWRINLDIIQKNAHHIVGFPEVGERRFVRSVLFIGGGNSKYLDEEAIYAVFPQAKIAKIPDTGHWLYVEAPDAFCRLVEDWLLAA
ncbi:alpha/beta hydrolase [Methylomonas sp. Kb3]|uniref:alpha/beta fold hydrolase n=1 Tax=Methylomonas sp. Kb3 TaxID=1611544 RepID=UPI000C330B65|nr:alpha/beta fold hydrolase [Methylomonas sp. Kb3]PKD41231.1 alpha/beta hydrolase [Methylomonas sp. Kb3]